MEQIEDQELVKSAKEDLEQFADIYDAYINKIYRYFLLRTSHRETAEDLTSQTFLNALRGFNSFEGDQKLAPWLFTIAHNVLVNNYKTKKSELLREDYDIESGVDIEVQTDKKMAEELLKIMVDQLPERDKEIIYLRVTSDLSFSEVAQILNIEENTARTAYYRAVQKLINSHQGRFKINYA